MSMTMITAGGREYALGGAAALMPTNAPDLHDIAHHLAQINRFNGACARPYSVAEHSLLVERIGQQRGASPITRLALLMHDAHEAYAGDATRPQQAALGIAWTGFEATHMANVRRHFGLQTVFASRRQEIHHCDLVALATERRDLLAHDPERHAPWPALDAVGAAVRPAVFSLDPHMGPDWRDVREAFIGRFRQLRALVAASQAAEA